MGEEGKGRGMGRGEEEVGRRGGNWEVEERNGGGGNDEGRKGDELVGSEVRSGER